MNACATRRIMNIAAFAPMRAGGANRPAATRWRCRIFTKAGSTTWPPARPENFSDRNHSVRVALVIAARHNQVRLSLKVVPMDGQATSLSCLTEPSNGVSVPLNAGEFAFAELLQALPVAVYTTDAAGRITFFNEAAAVLWGCWPELGKSEFCGSWRLYWPDGRP